MSFCLLSALSETRTFKGRRTAHNPYAMVGAVYPIDDGLVTLSGPCLTTSLGLTYPMVPTKEPSAYLESATLDIVAVSLEGNEHQFFPIV